MHELILTAGFSNWLDELSGDKSSQVRDIAAAKQIKRDIEQS